MAASGEICQLDTVTLAMRIAAKELSPVEVLEAVLDRVDRLDPTLHMFSTVVPERARQDAKRIEADLAAGRDVGSLAGVPVGVKDLIYTAGIRTAFGDKPVDLTDAKQRQKAWAIMYERFKQSGDLAARLAAAGVERLVDVRELPISRRRGYANTALSGALARGTVN